MKLVLKKLFFEQTLSYVKERLKDQPFFPQLISEKFDFRKGDFYMIVPESIDDAVIYNFDIGGYIYPIKRNADQNIVVVENVAKSVFLSLVNKYIHSSPNKRIGLEDLSFGPDSKYVKDTKRKFYVVRNNCFYLIDQSYEADKITLYLNWAKSWLTMGMFLNISTNENTFIEDYIFKELSDILKYKIFESIEALFIEVHDSETFLFWVDRENIEFIKLLKDSVKVNE
jgi:hypothetical protein